MNGPSPWLKAQLRYEREARRRAWLPTVPARILDLAIGVATGAAAVVILTATGVLPL